MYGNAFVEIDSADDVTATVVVRNRQGVNLVIYTGQHEVMPDRPGNGWILHTDQGDVTVTVEEGCGCGGTSVTPIEQVAGG